MRTYVFSFLWLCGVLSIVPVTGQSTDTKDGFEAYRIIADRNIFSRTRTETIQRRTRRNGPNERRPSVLNLYLLRGNYLSFSRGQCKHKFSDNLFGWLGGCRHVPADVNEHAHGPSHVPVDETAAVPVFHVQHSRPFLHVGIGRFFDVVGIDLNELFPQSLPVELRHIRNNPESI